MAGSLEGGGDKGGWMKIGNDEKGGRGQGAEREDGDREGIGGGGDP